MTFLACVLLAVILALLVHLSDIGQAAPRSESDSAPKRRHNPPAPSGPASSGASSPATNDTDTLSPEAEIIYARLRSEGASEVYARAYAKAYVAHLARGFSGSGAASGDFGEHVDDRYGPMTMRQKVTKMASTRRGVATTRSTP
ncbi:MAG: hypothetical protein IPG63_07490 [Xanthomonadales bacterium]|nr:hypothetical protein [Xanthomonadales bacterium]